MAPIYLSHWAVWNVGQGQWVTHIRSMDCVHYDIGGEFGSFKNLRTALLTACGHKLNRLNLTHWDYDHYLNIPIYAKAVAKLCWETMPQPDRQKKYVKKVLNLKIPPCPKSINENNQQLWAPPFSKNTNDASFIFYSARVLIPGDSPIHKEKEWLGQMEQITDSRVLILGHHGSKTSTGHQLLTQLKSLKMAISSARFKKYRHPHPETVKRVTAYGISLLRTEDWGHIRFEN